MLTIEQIAKLTCRYCRAHKPLEGQNHIYYSGGSFDQYPRIVKCEQDMDTAKAIYTALETPAL